MQFGIGRTCQHLEVQTIQHVPRGILNKGWLTSGHSQAMNSAIGKHLLAINSFRTNYQDDCFSVLHRARYKVQLNILEAIYITIDQPSLCRQAVTFWIYWGDLIFFFLTQYFFQIIYELPIFTTFWQSSLMSARWKGPRSFIF